MHILFLLSIYSFYFVYSWSYPYSAGHWGEISAICSEGTSQSPIDLPRHRGLSQEKLNVTFGSISNVTASREHSLKWTVDDTASATLNFNNVIYSLLQMHCHTESEHTVDG